MLFFLKFVMAVNPVLSLSVIVYIPGDKSVRLCQAAWADSVRFYLHGQGR